jgi:NADPH2:quinone reductase
VRAATIRAYGEPPVVDEERPAPEATADQALVEVSAAAITPLDVLCASGTSYFGEPPLPYVPGVQGVGRVVSGSALQPGTRVWFPTTAGMRPGDGSMAQQAVVPAEELVELPDGVDDVEVAALGLSAVAAWMCLTWRGGLRSGDHVLVLGAGGVVGQVAAQAARLLGARRVVAACRSQHAQDRAKECGADAVVPIFDEDDVASLRERLASACEEPLDLVVDPLFGVPASAAAGLLGQRGRLVNLGSSAGETAVFESASLRSRTAAVLGYTNNDITRAQRREALLAVLRHAAEDGLSVSHEPVALDAITDAWRRQAEGAARDRIVVRVR